MIKNIVFDFGGVLMDWNPRYLYKDCFQTEEEMEWFLSTICTNDWNRHQDAGRSLAEGTRLLLEWYRRERPVFHPLTSNDSAIETQSVAPASSADAAAGTQSVAPASSADAAAGTQSVAPASSADAAAVTQSVAPKEEKDYSDLIKLYYGRWEVMLHKEIIEAVELVRQLKNDCFQIYGLTNWSAETLPIAYARFNFFKYFDGIVASGEEYVAKPEKAIYQILLDRYQLIPEETLFIDDNQANLDAAEQFGINTFLFDPNNPSDSCYEIKKVVLGHVITL